MSKLHIFDMDGTLLKGSACLELARHLGQLEAVSSIEDRWVRGEVSHLAFWEECLPLWEGLDDAIIDKTFAATSWMNGIEAVWADIARRGEHSAVITRLPSFSPIGSWPGASERPKGRESTPECRPILAW